MRAGKLNRLVRIEAPVATQDEFGQPLLTWSPVATVWADVRHQGGLESLRADKPVSTVRASVRIRRRTDVDASMRVVLGSAIYDIRAVLPDEEGREYLDLVCEIGATDG